MCLKHLVTLWIYFHLMLWIKVPIRPARSHMRNMFDRGVTEWWLHLNENNKCCRLDSENDTVARQLLSKLLVIFYSSGQRYGVWYGTCWLPKSVWHGRSRTFTEKTGGLWQKSSKSSVRVVRSCPVQNKWFTLAERNRVSHWLNMESLKVVFWPLLFINIFINDLRFLR